MFYVAERVGAGLARAGFVRFATADARVNRAYKNPRQNETEKKAAKAKTVKWVNGIGKRRIYVISIQ